MMNPNFMQLLTQFRQNPMAMLSQKYNLPQNLNDPNAILQHLLNTNQVTQEQVNQAMQMRNNPMFQNMFKR